MSIPDWNAIAQKPFIDQVPRNMPALELERIDQIMTLAKQLSPAGRCFVGIHLSCLLRMDRPKR
jgi:hypothetical protein